MEEITVVMAAMMPLTTPLPRATPMLSRVGSSREAMPETWLTMSP